MFSKTDFWIGLAVGAVAGIFGYRFMQERSQQLAALESGQAELSVAELQRQKEELEDLIAAQSALDKEGSVFSGGAVARVSRAALF